MTTISKQQIAAIHGLLRKHGLSDDKASIVEQISNGRTTSTRQLTFTEAQDWINAMNTGKQWKGKEAKSAEDPRRRMVNHIFAMAHEMGWVKRKTVVVSDKLVVKNDYTDVHAWIEKYGYLKKKLNDYKYEELPTLVTAFKSVYFGKLKKRNETPKF